MRRSTCASRASILPSPSRDHSYWPPSPFNKDPRSTWIPIPWEGLHNVQSGLGAARTPSISSTESASRSVSPPSSLTSIDKVHRLLLKQQGFSQRYTDWQSASSLEEQDRRLCIFYFIEFRHLQATQHIKHQAYVSQLEDLESQLANLHQAHAHINNLDDFQLSGYLDELSQLHQAVEKAERTSLLARAQHLRLITCKLCEQAITIANTLQQLRCYMPRKAPPTPTPVPVQLQRRFAATRPGLRRSDLGTPSPWFVPVPATRRRRWWWRG
jgi:hypothetical protein